MESKGHRFFSWLMVVLSHQRSYFPLAGVVSQDFICPYIFVAQRIHGTAIFTHIYHKNQPFMYIGEYASPMDRLGTISWVSCQLGRMMNSATGEQPKA